jgi:hypothetical protein
MTSTTPAEVAFPANLTEAILVATDSKGRVRVTKGQRRAILDQFEQSGMSGARFAKVAGIKYSTFAGWRQRYQRSKPPRPRSSPRLLEAVIEPNRAAQPDSFKGLILHLAGGTRLELFSLAEVPMAAALVKALQIPASPC